MILKELMREGLEVFRLPESSRISAAASMMREKRIGSIVIVDDADSVVGIITDRDIAMGLALGAATPDSFVSEVMSRDVECVSENISLFGVTQQFRKLDVKRLPVVDQEKRLVGIVSVDDVIAMLAREMFNTCTALEPKLGYMV
jgi:CBS domain-containing protein